MKNILVYGSKWCFYCKLLEQWLTGNKYDYGFKDVDLEVNKQELNNYEVQAIPFVVIKDKRNDTENAIIGYKPDQIKKLIDS